MMRSVDSTILKSPDGVKLIPNKELNRPCHLLFYRLQDPQLLKHRHRWPIEALKRNIADVADGLPAFGRAVISAGAEGTNAAEERRRLLEFRLGGAVITDVVADRVLLLLA